MRVTAGLALFLGAVLGGPAAAQTCGLAAAGAVRAGAGVVHYGIGGGLTGLSAGADIEGALASANDLELRVGYRFLVFSEGPDSHVGRFAAALPLPLPRIGGFGLCLTGHVGGSWLPTDQGDVAAVGAGGGLRLVRPLGGGALRTVPFVEVRGLFGSTTGNLGGVGVDGSARSVGGVAGLSTRLGPALVRVAGSIDHLPAGLGVTPYPTWAAHLSVGVPF